MADVEYGLSGDFVFKSAVEFLESKEPLEADVYKTLEQKARDRAFTVSGYSIAEILNTFLQELVNAIEAGTTKKQFQDNMNDFLERNGYKAVNPWHADIIFRTNVQTAYAAGHYENMQAAKKLRPYWQYRTVGDGNVRESHLAMEGRIYLADDPIWNVWYPPNGFRCRCAVVSLSKRQVEQRNLKVSSEPPNNITGNGKVPVFPDKGFSNNPAKTPWRPDVSKLDKNVRKLISDKKGRR